MPTFSNGLIIPAGNDVKEMLPYSTIGWSVGSWAIVEVSMESAKITENWSTVWPSNPTFGNISKGNAICIGEGDL